MAMQRIWGNWQYPGVLVTTTGNGKPKNETEALAPAVVLIGADGATPASPSNPVPVDATGSGTQDVNIAEVGGSGITTGVPTFAVPAPGVAAYSATSLIAVAASAGDFASISGSASKIVKVTRVTITATATAAAIGNIFLTRRSTADTGGTSSAMTVTPHDSTAAAGTAVATAFTANPTPGALVGAVASAHVTISTTGGALPAVPLVFDLSHAPVILRAAAQNLVLNLSGATYAGGAFSVTFDWTEE